MVSSLARPRRRLRLTPRTTVLLSLPSGRASSEPESGSVSGTIVVSADTSGDVARQKRCIAIQG